MRRCILTLFFWVSLIFSYAQSIRYEKILEEATYKIQRANKILQDKLGYVWIASSNRLHQYDGYKLRTFEYLPNDPDGIHGSWITNMVNDSQGRIWIQYATGGMDCYDPVTDSFTFITEADGISTKHLSQNDQSLLETKDGNIWLCTNKGLNLFTVNGEIRHYLKSAKGLPTNVVNCLMEDSAGLLWIGTEQGLTCFDREKDELRNFNDDPRNAPFSQTDIAKIYEDSRGDLWVAGAYNGVMNITLNKKGFPINAKAYRFHPLKDHDDILFIQEVENVVYIGTNTGLYAKAHHQANFQELWSGIAENFVVDNAQRIWVSGRPNTNILLVKKGKVLEHLSLDQDHPYNDRIMSMTLLEDNNILIGTEWKGIYKINVDQKPFYTIPHFYSNAKLDLTHIYSITNQGDLLWLATQKGLTSFNLKSQERKDFFSDRGSISVITKSWDGGLWIGLFNGKLFKYYPETGEEIAYQNDPAQPHYFEGWSVRDIKEDEEGNLWVSAHNHGLFFLKKGSDHFEKYTEEGKPGYRLLTNRTLQILLSSDGDVYVGSVMGLNKLNPRSGEISVYSYDENQQQEGGIQSNYIRMLYEDQKQRIWVGTSSGLHLLDSKTGQFTLYDESDGLTENSVKAIFEDRNGQFWITTDYGISLFNEKENKWQSFYKEDGLHDNHFYTNSMWYDQEKAFIYFGGREGLTYFDPTKIVNNENEAVARISGLKINGQKVGVYDTLKSGFIMNKTINFIDKIVLNHDETLLEFILSSIHFASPLKNQIEYRIAAVDPQWRKATDSHLALYNSLPAGNHTLMVRVSNNDGLWSEEMATMEIVVLAPWWESWWFRCGVMIILGIIVLVYFRYKKYKQLINERFLKSEVEKQTKALKASNDELLVRQNEIIKSHQEIDRQREDLLEKNQRIELLQSFGYKITSSIDINVIFDQLSQELSELIGADRLMLGHLNYENNTIEFWGRDQESGAIIKEIVSRTEISRLSVYAVQLNEALLVDNIGKEAAVRLSAPDQKYEQLDWSGIYQPLSMKGRKTIGILVAQNTQPNQFTAEHVELLKHMGNFITIAMENAISYEQIQLQADSLKELSQKNDRFFTEISHELKTPLSLILSPVQELLRSSKEFSLNEKNVLTLIEKNAKRLQRLVTQILEIKRAEVGMSKLQVSENDYVEVVSSIVSSFQWMAKEKEISLNLETQVEGAHSIFDLDKVEKIFFNLINNAIKYTYKKGKVTIMMNTISQQDRSYIVIEVKDNGMGIPAHDVDKVFDRYYRSELVDVGQNGTGIGLSLVKHLVELHHGSISVSSNADNGAQDRGTVFTVTLPIEHNVSVSCAVQDATLPNFEIEDLKPVSLENKQDHLPTSENKQKVLIVEDNEELRNYLKSCLQHMWDIKVAGDGYEGLQVAKTEAPDLIISDVMMPRMDGFKLCKALKEDAATAAIPVVFLTAKGDTDAVNEGYQLGVVDYMQKPFDINIIKKKIENILNVNLGIKEKVSQNNSINIDVLSDSSDDQKFMREVVKVLEDHVSDPQLDVSFLTEKLGLSRTVLYEKLRGISGMSINEFIKHYRMQLAIKILKEKNVNVTDIATFVGFSDAKYFSKCFKREFGETPKSFTLRQHSRKSEKVELV
ncbi:hybrid sensor histidine kinase/response regulator transcription factor [Persicobacter diffluens]|uniref:histidine kinase n=1 Tax=Persicobacter diffluens TaxID=981 RepID=A0AAN5APH9_9BACT|nr:hypothetical protein PEDI_48980 [Persicobacter diffluens]